MRNKKLLIIIIIVFISRLLFIHPWLEDWDSVQFALALNQYSIIDHQPHAPGYILYIAMAQIIKFITKNDQLSLSFLSALFSSLTIIPIFYLTKEMFNQTKALIASLIFAVIPIVWLLSGVALTNIPGNFFITTIAFLLYKYRKQPKFINYISFFAGFSLGVRTTEASIMIALIALVLLKLKNSKQIIKSSLLFMIGIITWIIPLILISSLSNFIKAYLEIAQYIINHDALLNYKYPPSVWITQRLQNLFFITKTALTLPALSLGIISILFIIKKKLHKDFKYQFLLTWIISYLIPLSLFFNQEVPRYVLPLATPLAIVLSSQMPIILTSLLIILLSAQSLNQLYRFNQTPPPPVSAVLYLKNTINPTKTLIISSFTYRHLQYYAPEFRIIRAENTNIQDLQDNSMIIFDSIPVAHETLKNSKLFKKTKQITFKGHKDIHSRVPEITLIIYEKTKSE